MIVAVCANPAVDRVYFVDEFTMGEVHRPLRTAVSAGGKGLNVARVASILGARVTATGFLGGYSGAFIAEKLKETKIIDQFLRTEKETHTCINISDKNALSGEILESGERLDPADEDAFLEHFKTLIREADVITVSGSQPQGLSKEFYVKLLHLARKEKIRCVFDTSGESLKQIIEARPFMVKPNRFELGQYMGRELKTLSDCQEALLTLYEKGVEFPLCTLGGEGALLYDQNRFVRFVTPAVSPVNSVGSGDSAVAGIAFGLSRNMRITDCVKYGMAAGMTNALYEQTGFVDRETVEKYFQQIETAS